MEQKLNSMCGDTVDNKSMVAKMHKKGEQWRVKKRIYWIFAGCSLIGGAVLVGTGNGGWVFLLILTWLVGFGVRYLRGLDRKAFDDAENSFPVRPASLPSYDRIRNPKECSGPDRLWYEQARESLKQALLPTQMATVGLLVAFLLAAVSSWDASSFAQFFQSVHVSLEMWIGFWLFEAGIQAYQEGALRQRYRVLILEWNDHAKKRWWPIH